jgi:hypothetical protein
MRWAEEFLNALNDLDHRNILTIYLLYPNESEGSAQGPISHNQESKTRMFPIFGPLDMAMFVQGEWGAEAGNMLVTG